MLCRVEMPTNEQIYGRFYRYKMLHGSGGPSKGSLIMMPLLAVVLAVFMFFTGLPIVVPVVVVAAVLGYLWYLFYRKPTSTFNKMPGAALQTEVTIFTDAGFNRSVRSEEGGLPDTASMQYNALHSAVETNKDFYLYTGPGQAYLIDKAYFDKGTPDDLRATLRKQMGKKFTTKVK